MVNRSTSLSENIIGFCRYLRTKGFTVSPDHEADALKSMKTQMFRSEEELRLLLQLTLAKNKTQFTSFNQHFNDYWLTLNRAVDAKEKPSDKPTNTSQSKKQPSIDALKHWLNGNKSDKIQDVAFYDSHQKLFTKDFSAYSDDELWELKKEIKRIARSLINKKQRRFEASHHQQQLDVRKIIRNNLRRGGEIVDIFYKKRKESNLNLVLMCDVSKSMALYSQFLIQFLYAFKSVYSSVETFVFSGRLTNVSDYLKDSKFEGALQKLIDNLTHWSDGTRIGACLQNFEVDYSQHVIDHKSILIIVSDGLDMGDLQTLDQTLFRLYNKTGKIIWLNPLAGSTDFKPAVGGMKTALPYIDVLAPIHNLESLKKLPDFLTGVRRRKRKNKI